MRVDVGARIGYSALPIVARRTIRRVGAAVLREDHHSHRKGTIAVLRVSDSLATIARVEPFGDVGETDQAVDVHTCTM